MRPEHSSQNETDGWFAWVWREEAIAMDLPPNVSTAEQLLPGEKPTQIMSIGWRLAVMGLRNRVGVMDIEEDSLDVFEWRTHVRRMNVNPTAERF